MEGKMKWITDRNPTDDECADAGDVGFILCVSGVKDNWVLDHAIMMNENYFEGGRWAIEGVFLRNITVHGWMLPPTWEE